MPNKKGSPFYLYLWIELRPMPINNTNRAWMDAGCLSPKKVEETWRSAVVLALRCTGAVLCAVLLRVAWGEITSFVFLNWGLLASKREQETVAVVVVAVADRQRRHNPCAPATTTTKNRIIPFQTTTLNNCIAAPDPTEAPPFRSAVRQLRNQLSQ